jgi:hypothetical protein
MASGGGKRRKASVVVAEAPPAARDGRGGAGEDQGGARDGDGALFRARRGDGSTPPICTCALTSRTVVSL